MKNGSSGFPVKQDSEIAPRRQRTRSKEFLIKKFSDLCELCASAVNFFTKIGMTENFKAG